MAPATIPPVEAARSIFTRLGYAVSGEGRELRAERKWRTVRVTAVGADDATAEATALADGGDDDRDFRCFVTYRAVAGDLRERLEGVEPPYEWAVIGVRDVDGSEYDVVGGAEAS